MTRHPEDNPLLDWVRRQVHGICSDIRDLVETVRGLPGMHDWTPSDESPIRNAMPALFILRLGMILSRINDSSFESLLASLSESLRNSGSIDREDEAELITAALVRPWCDRVRYIPRSKHGRTPDLIATARGKKIEIEVTTANRKEEQERRRHAASALHSKLRSIPSDRHIVVHYLDPLTEAEEQAIIEAACRLDIGQATETENRWHVAIAPPQGPTFNTMPMTPIPAWFPDQLATPASLSAGVHVAGSASAPTASAQLRWGLSTKSYINPLSKKAERPQGSGESAFAIAMDITQLPGGEQWYASELAGYWQQWPHVSGVLLFHGPAWWVGIGLRVSYTVLLNPYARHPLGSNWESGKWERPL